MAAYVGTGRKSMNDQIFGRRSTRRSLMHRGSTTAKLARAAAAAAAVVVVVVARVVSTVVVATIPAAAAAAAVTTMAAPVPVAVAVAAAAAAAAAAVAVWGLPKSLRIYRRLRQRSRVHFVVYVRKRVSGAAWGVVLSS